MNNVLRANVHTYVSIFKRRIKATKILTQFIAYAIASC